MAVNFSRDEKGPYEMNARLGKAGGCANAQTEAISRLVSLLMSLGVDSKLIYHQLRGIRCPVSALDRGDKVLSCADAISKVFERELGFDRRGARPCAPTAPDETPDIPHRLFEEEEEIIKQTISESKLLGETLLQDRGRMVRSRKADTSTYKKEGRAPAARKRSRQSTILADA